MIDEGGVGASRVRAQEAFRKLIEQDAEDALLLVTGMFVSLTLEMIRRQGQEPIGSITIDGGKQRDITIWPPK